jgi:hypothetical protein
LAAPSPQRPLGNNQPLGAQRFPLIVPKSLIGQWQSELLNLFGVQARENEAQLLRARRESVLREFAVASAVPLRSGQTRLSISP